MNTRMPGGEDQLTDAQLVEALIDAAAENRESDCRSALEALRVEVLRSLKGKRP